MNTIVEVKKNPFKSKTLWVNFVVAAIAFVPSVQSAVSPEAVAMVLTTVNILLRLLTKDKIGLEA